MVPKRDIVSEVRFVRKNKPVDIVFNWQTSTKDRARFLLEYVPESPQRYGSGRVCILQGDPVTVEQVKQNSIGPNNICILSWLTEEDREKAKERGKKVCNQKHIEYKYVYALLVKNTAEDTYYFSDYNLQKNGSALHRFTNVNINKKAIKAGTVSIPMVIMECMLQREDADEPLPIRCKIPLVDPRYWDFLKSGVEKKESSKAGNAAEAKEKEEEKKKKKTKKADPPPAANKTDAVQEGIEMDKEELRKQKRRERDRLRRQKQKEEKERARSQKPVDDVAEEEAVEATPEPKAPEETVEAKEERQKEKKKREKAVMEKVTETTKRLEDKDATSTDDIEKERKREQKREKDRLYRLRKRIEKKIAEREEELGRSMTEEEKKEFTEQLSHMGNAAQSTKKTKKAQATLVVEKRSDPKPAEPEKPKASPPPVVEKQVEKEPKKKKREEKKEKKEKKHKKKRRRHEESDEEESDISESSDESDYSRKKRKEKKKKQKSKKKAPKKKRSLLAELNGEESESDSDSDADSESEEYSDEYSDEEEEEDEEDLYEEDEEDGLEMEALDSPLEGGVKFADIPKEFIHPCFADIRGGGFLDPLKKLFDVDPEKMAYGCTEDDFIPEDNPSGRKITKTPDGRVMSLLADYGEHMEKMCPQVVSTLNKMLSFARTLPSTVKKGSKLSKTLDNLVSVKPKNPAAPSSGPAAPNVVTQRLAETPQVGKHLSFETLFPGLNVVFGQTAIQLLVKLLVDKNGMDRKDAQKKASEMHIEDILKTTRELMDDPVSGAMKSTAEFNQFIVTHPDYRQRAAFTYQMFAYHMWSDVQRARAAVEADVKTLDERRKEERNGAVRALKLEMDELEKKFAKEMNDLKKQKDISDMTAGLLREELEKLKQKINTKRTAESSSNESEENLSEDDILPLAKKSRVDEEDPILDDDDILPSGDVSLGDSTSEVVNLFD